VEKLLASEGTSRKELGREAFTERVWEWKVCSQGAACHFTMHHARSHTTKASSSACTAALADQSRGRKRSELVETAEDARRGDHGAAAAAGRLLRLVP
jgi:hypothetical protein